MYMCRFTDVLQVFVYSYVTFNAQLVYVTYMDWFKHPDPGDEGIIADVSTFRAWLMIEFWCYYMYLVAAMVFIARLIGRECAR